MAKSPCNSDPSEILEAITGIKSAEATFEAKLQEASDAALGNAGKFDKFVNGGMYEDVQLGSGEPTPTLRNLSHLVKSAAATFDGADVSGKFSGAANGGTELRMLADRFGDVVNVLDFGASGDGDTDDSEAIQSALNSGGLVYIPKGVYKITSTLYVTSNTSIIGCGSGLTVINFTDSSFWSSAFVCEIGTSNVSFSGLEIRGPFYTENDNYVEDYEYFDNNPTAQNPDVSNNTVVWSRYNCGIDIRGRAHAQWMDKENGSTERRLAGGENYNIRVSDCHVEGFGFAALNFDEVENLWVERCTLRRCAYSGVQMLGCKNFTVSDCVVEHLYPGNIDNGINRVYGVTATRCYGAQPPSGNPNAFTSDLELFGSAEAVLAYYRQSENGVIARNKVSYCLGWKGLDTHGGKKIVFESNTVLDAHIGIGLDMGGPREYHGFASCEDCDVINNRLVRITPDLAWEGNAKQYDSRYATCGAGINVSAKDENYEGSIDDDQYAGGFRTKIRGNTLIGWGDDMAYGAISAAYHRGLIIDSNIIENSRRAAIMLTNVTSECRISNNIIRNVRGTSFVTYGQGIVCTQTQDSYIPPFVTGNSFSQDIDVQLYCIQAYLRGSESAESVYIDDTNHFSGSSNEPISLIRSVNSVAESPITQRIALYGKIDGTDYDENDNVSFGGYGIESVERTATGNYTITTKIGPLLTTGAISVQVTPVGNSSASLAYYMVGFGAKKIYVYSRSVDGTFSAKDSVFCVTANYMSNYTGE